MNLGIGAGIQRGSPAAAAPDIGSIESSTIFDLSAQVTSSTDDAGKAWKNLTEAPADAELQTAYDWTYGQSSGDATDDPVLTGSAGDAGTYYLFDGSANFTLETITTFWEDIHKTGSGDCWIALSFLYQSGAGAQVMFATNLTASGAGIRVITSSNQLYFQQRGAATVSAASGITLVDETNYIAVISHDRSANQTTFWVNSTTGTDIAQTFSASTTDANAGAVIIGAAGNYGGDMLTGTRMYACAGGNDYLDDTRAEAIMDVVANRQTAARYPFL